MHEAKSNSDLEDFWAITSYFNPVGYRRRLANYRIFRRLLQIPLMTVELVYGAAPELDAADADILIQLHGTGVLWQKERLLNVALSRLPAHVKNVAWLDCDVIFPDANWVVQAKQELTRVRLAQAFSRMYDLPAGADPTRLSSHSDEPSGYGISNLVSAGQWSWRDFRPVTASHVRGGLFGLAWFAHRELMQKHGFYDAMVIGSGDRAMACGALGRFDDAIAMARLNETRAQHYLRWARPFYDEVHGSVGHIPGPLFHLWHGAIADRRYLERHIDFAGLNFDPERDLRLDAQGLWEWSGTRPELERFLKKYFCSRREDAQSEIDVSP